MATKVNETIWGTVPEAGNAIRLAPNSLGTCYNNGTFDPDDINTLDKTVVPWGVPYCGLGGMSYLKKLRMPIPIPDSSYFKAGTLTTFEIEEFVGTNNPLVLMGVGQSGPSKYNYFSCRMEGAINSSETAFTSNAASDRGENVPTSSNSIMWNYKPIVYLDYQKVIVQVDHFILWDRNGGTRIVAYNINNYPASGRTWDDYELLGFTYTIYQRISGGGWTPNGYYMAIPVNEKDTSKFVLDKYFGQEIRPQKWVPFTYRNAIKTTFYGDTGSYQIYSTAITKEADSETLHPYDTYWTGELHSIGNYIDGTQTFDNVSYTMEKKCGFMQGGVWFEIVKGSELPGNDHNGQNVQMGVYYKINGYEPGTSKIDAWAKIIAHEMAFLGLPFQIKISGDAATPAKTASLADDDVFLPIFDMDHMVTTGRYTTDLAEKQLLPNYTWENIFDSTIPNWDSSYNPPKPGPSPEPGGETPWDDNPITRIQEGYWTGFGGNTYVSSVRDFEDSFKYVQSQVSNNIESLSTTAKNALNAYIQASTEEDKQEAWGPYVRAAECLDYATKTNSELYTKGPETNYTDCVLSILRYPFDIRDFFHRDGTERYIKWGCVYAISSGTTDIWHVDGYQTGQIVEGGTLYVEKRYQNFLNYAPYTTAELYIPYCGSVPIDLEIFAGHTIDVKYLVDWFSGECLALIYRDRVVVDQIPGQLGTPVSIVAEDIQSYKNAMFNGGQTLKAQKAALRSSAVKGMGEVMNPLGNLAATIVGGGERSGEGASSIGGSFSKGFSTGAGIAQNYQNKKTAQYNLDHTTIDFKQIGSNGPSVGSWNEQVCRLVLYYPTFLEDYDPVVYGHTVGFACLFNKTLGNFSGLTVCSSVDTTGLTDATESEKTLLEEALKSGAYL